MANDPTTTAGGRYVTGAKSIWESPEDDPIVPLVSDVLNVLKKYGG